MSDLEIGQLQPHEPCIAVPVSKMISLRDFFASQAMAGWFGNPAVRSMSDEELLEHAEGFYAMADAMLKAGGKT